MCDYVEPKKIETIWRLSNKTLSLGKKKATDPSLCKSISIA